MERDIKAGKDPYQDWVALAQGEAWRVKASASGDVVQAKLDLTKNNLAQRRGVSWVFNNKAGGVGLLPIRPVRDLSVAGYNITLNKPTTALANTDYSASADRNARIVKAFSTPEAMATFTAEVLGDQSIYLCEGETDCPAPTSTATAMGLGPKFEAELDFVAPRLNALANAAPGTYAMLAEINAPGIAVSPQLMESIRKLPPDIRGVAVDRIAQEMALQRVVDKALVARNALLAALSLPEATAAAQITKDVQTKIDQMSKYINDVMFEFRIRKEMTGESALAIMNDAIVRGSQSQKVRDAVMPEVAPVNNGRVLK
jgi:integrating conjugative element protein (TIGR03755 family)